VQHTPRQQAALAQLSAVPGVVGSMVFDPEGALVASEFPPVFDAGGLRDLAAQLSADGYFQSWLGGDEATLDLCFGDGRVVVRSLQAGWLLVLSTLQANPQLLSMSLTQVVRRLRPQPGDAAGPRAAGPAQTVPPPPKRSPIDQLKAIAAEDLGAHAAQAIEMLAAAGPAHQDLVRAAGEVEKMVRLFISKKKAEEIGRRMRDCLNASA